MKIKANPTLVLIIISNSNKMSYCQLVIGPPGAGKSTYCHGMYQFCSALKRKIIICNLDPANDLLPYHASINICDLITLEDVMNTFDLGPNGALLYCMEYLADNLSWLKEQIDQFHGYYILFDLPGQVELFTHQKCLTSIIYTMQSQWNLQLCCVHLIDSHYCRDFHTFISCILTSLSTMCHLELPHINILSKIDLIQGDLPNDLEYYTKVVDLSYLLQQHTNQTQTFQQPLKYKH